MSTTHLSDPFTARRSSSSAVHRLGERTCVINVGTDLRHLELPLVDEAVEGRDARRLPRPRLRPHVPAPLRDVRAGAARARVGSARGVAAARSTSPRATRAWSPTSSGWSGDDALGAASVHDARAARAALRARRLERPAARSSVGRCASNTASSGRSTRSSTAARRARRDATSARCSRCCVAHARRGRARRPADRRHLGRGAAGDRGQRRAGLRVAAAQAARPRHDRDARPRLRAARAGRARSTCTASSGSPPTGRRRARAPAGRRTPRVALAQALALWRGPALVRPRRRCRRVRPIAARLDELRLAALERRLEADSTAAATPRRPPSSSRSSPSIRCASGLRALQMLALYRCGRQADALAAFRAARGERSSSELGLEPGAELQELERAILRQDPALAAPTTGARPRRDGAAPVARSAARPTSPSRRWRSPRIGGPLAAARPRAGASRDDRRRGRPSPAPARCPAPCARCRTLARQRRRRRARRASPRSRR